MNYYEANQSVMYNNYGDYSAAQNHSNNTPVSYQPNGSPVPYQSTSHQNSSPVQYQQNHDPVAYQQNHQNSTATVQYQQSHHYHNSMAYYSPNHAPSQPLPPPSEMHYAPPLDNRTANQEMYRRSIQQTIPPHQYTNHVAPPQASSLHMHMQYPDANYQSPQSLSQQQQYEQQYQSSQMSHTYMQTPQTNQHNSSFYELQHAQPLPTQDHNIQQPIYNDLIPSVTETKTINSYADDIEEQIEASTIVLKNGSDKLQKITIKYRKEKVEDKTSGGSDNGSLSTMITPTTKVQKVKKSKKSKINNASMQMNVETESESSQFHDDQFSESNDSFSTPNRINKLSKSKRTAKSKSSKLEPTYLQDDSDSCSSSGFAKLYGKYSEEANDSTGMESGRNVRFNFTGATSTPIRNNNNINQYQSLPCSSAKPSYKSNESSSKSSTPRNTHKSLRRRTSNSLVENDDSMTSFSMVEPNSFFETEANDELHQQRLDKALNTIDMHFKKDHIDPFSSELCKAFLTKANFPSREHNEFYKLSNTLLSKLSNTKSVTIGDTRFNVEKEIGRGAYGSVYRGMNTNTSETVALKYQKPPNTWELYICFEVQQRIKDPNLVG